MIICKNCGINQPIGTMFCPECGENLIDAEQTKKIKEQPSGQQKNTLFASKIPSLTHTPSSKHVLSLLVQKSGRKILLDMSKNLTVGRKDSKKEIFPDIDLDEEGGYEEGVSRQHAIISLQQGVCVIEDLNSSNGTFLNGQRLPPYQCIPFQTGDEIQLGSLALRVLSLP